MVIDAHTIERGAQIEADICVIGTGPAGLTLLKQLGRLGLRIIGLESGGAQFNPDAQALCQGSICSSDNYPPAALMTSRRRQLGGAANLWDDELEAGKGNELVRLVPLDAIDFERRSWVPHSGWPFTRADLERFYNEAFRELGIDDPGADSPIAAPDRRPLFTGTSRLATVFSRFAARSVFTKHFPKVIAGAENVSIYLNATVLELMVRDNIVRHARVATSPDREFKVAAAIFVLAAGGIDNARLLLLSNRMNNSGLGNQHDLVGRFFMDHPSFRLGILTPRRRDIFRSAAVYDHHLVNGQPVMGKLTFRETTMRQEEMLNICVTVTPRGRDYESAAANAFKRLVRSESPADAAGILRAHLGVLTRGWDEIIAKCYHKLTKTRLVYFENKGGWSRLPNPQRRFRKLEFCCLCEQSPDPANRVKLADTFDRLGQRQAELQWRWSEIDLRSIRRAQDILREECEQGGLGQFVRQCELDGSDRPAVATPHHHIGTTRMHDDPRQGVVNSNCRLHDVANLYVAGSSVFPTGGFANPTLTIIALALRLSYHLTELMKAPSSSVFSSASGCG